MLNPDFRDMLSAFIAEEVEFLEPNRIDILTSADGVDFDESWKQRVMSQVDGLDVPIMSVRHVIQNKRAVGRPRDLADALTLEEELQRRGERPQDAPPVRTFAGRSNAVHVPIPSSTIDADTNASL